MNIHVIITCAVTGSADTTAKYAAVPVTLEQIANAAIEAAKAGAAVAHVHVRDPETGEAGRNPICTANWSNAFAIAGRMWF